jgi:hypothetical protein
MHDSASSFIYLAVLLAFEGVATPEALPCHRYESQLGLCRTTFIYVGVLMVCAAFLTWFYLCLCCKWFSQWLCCFAAPLAFSCTRLLTLPALWFPLTLYNAVHLSWPDSRLPCSFLLSRHACQRLLPLCCGHVSLDQTRELVTCLLLIPHLLGV